MALPRCDTWPHAVKTPIRLQVPCLRCCTSQTTEPFIVAISLRKRLFSRLLPARKEQNHSGARSMRRWNAMVESGSNASGVAAAVSEGCGAVMASAIFSPDAGSTNWICSGNSPNCAKSPVYPMAFNNKKLFALNSLTNSGQSCPNAAQGFDQRSSNGFCSSKMQNQIPSGRRKRLGG